VWFRVKRSVDGAVAGLLTEPPGRPKVSWMAGDLRSGVSAGSETRAERGAVAALFGDPRRAPIPVRVTIRRVFSPQRGHHKPAQRRRSLVSPLQPFGAEAFTAQSLGAAKAAPIRPVASNVKAASGCLVCMGVSIILPTRRRESALPRRNFLCAWHRLSARQPGTTGKMPFARSVIVKPVRMRGNQKSCHIVVLTLRARSAFIISSP